MSGAVTIVNPYNILKGNQNADFFATFIYSKMITGPSKLNQDWIIHLRILKNRIEIVYKLWHL